MNVYYWSLYLWIIASYLPITARSSKEEIVPVCLEGEGISSRLFQDYSSNTTILEVKQAWVEARKREDPDYDDYYVKVFVKLPQKNRGNTALYKQKEIKNLKRTQLKKFWKDVKQVSSYLTCKFEAQLREAEITFTDRTRKKSKEYKKVYDFKTTIEQIKKDFLLDHYPPAARESFMTKEEIAIKYYFIYINTVYTLKDTLSIGHLAYHFNIKDKKPQLRLDIVRVPIPATPTPPPAAPLSQTEDIEREQEEQVRLPSPRDSQDDIAYSIEAMDSAPLKLFPYTPLVIVAASIGWIHTYKHQKKKRFKKQKRDKSV